MADAANRFNNDLRWRDTNHDRQRMLTPSYVLEPIRQLLNGIALDPCTEPDNPTGAETWYFQPFDGLKLPWDYRNVFCNPPYGEAKDAWVDRSIEAGLSRPIILLIPSHTETKTFQRAMQAASSICFVKARLRFGVVRENGRQEAASHGSALIGFSIDLTPLAALGKVYR